MSDDLGARAPEPQPDDRPEQPAAPQADAPPEAKAHRKAGAKATSGRPAPEAAQRKAAPKRPAEKPAAAPKPAPRLQRKAEPPAPKAGKQAASKRAAPKAEAPKPAGRVQRKAEPASKPAKAEPAVPRAEAPAVVQPPSAAPATARPAIQRSTPAAEPLDAIGRRILGRLERTERALSPWTQQSLRLQQPTPLQRAAEPKAGPERPLAQPAPTPEAAASGPGRQGVTAGTEAQRASPMGSLATRVQRREQQGTIGTFGRLAQGVERVDRFATRIAAHFPPLAAKYEPPPAPEAGTTSAPPAPSGPSFTYYPEGAGSSGISQPTMTAAEVLERFGATTSTPPVQRASAPADDEAKPRPPRPISPRDPSRVRRFSKIEELPPRGAAPVEPPPEPKPVQRKPELSRPTPPARPQFPSPEKEQAALRAARRRPRFEEVSPPAGEAPEVQRTPSQPAAPTPPAPSQPGPMRWDHLNNLPPSMQQQLERVQRRLAEQAGLVRPPSQDVSGERPFFPRNPNPRSAEQARSPEARPAAGEGETETPIAFGPDLQPRPADVQRRVEPSPQRPITPPQPPMKPAAVRVDEASLEAAEPETATSGAAMELVEPAAAPPVIQRMPEAQPATDLTPSEVEMPLVAPLEVGPAEAQGDLGPTEGEVEVKPSPAAVQRPPEFRQPMEPPPGELTLRKPAPEAPTVQRQPAELPARPTAPPVLRQPEPPEDTAKPQTPTLPAATATKSAEPAGAETPEPKRLIQGEAEPKTVVQRSPLPEQQPLVLRVPTPPAPLQAPKTRPSAPVQRAPAEAESSRPETLRPAAVVPPQPGEPEALAAPQSSVPEAEIQREVSDESQASLPLRLPTPEASAETPVEPTGPALSETVEPPPVLPVVQRQARPSDELPLIAPPESAGTTPAMTIEPGTALPAPRQPEPPAGEMPLRTAPPTPPGPGTIQRQLDEAVAAEQSAAQRTTPPPSTGMEPFTPITPVHRVEALPPSTGRTADMPLRQPALALEPEPSGQPAGPTPQLSLGSQIYARGLKDAGLPVFGALATSLRGSLQRKPASVPPVGAAAPLAPLPTAGLARTAAVRTPVLPQARLQRILESDENTTTQVPPAPPAPRESTELPLAPTGTTPVNAPTSNQSPTQGRPRTVSAPPPRMTAPKPGGSLPLAPVIGGHRAKPETDTSTTEVPDDLDALLSDTEETPPETPSASAGENELDLNFLADELLPYIKRLLAVERERHDPV